MANYTTPNTQYSKKAAYSDFDTDFNVHPVTGKLSVLKDAEAVKQAVKNLILTKKLERPYEPFYGSNVVGALFEPIDALTGSMLEKDIEVAIRNFEPRASLISVAVLPDEDNNLVTLKILFSITNIRDPQRLELNLERIR